MMDIKKFIKEKGNQWKKESAEAKKYREELKKKVKIARRKAFVEASIKEAEKQAKRKAKAIYSPKTRAGYYDKPVSPAMDQLIFGTAPTPKQVVQKVLNGKKKKKGKKKKPSHVYATIKIPSEKLSDIIGKY